MRIKPLSVLVYIFSFLFSQIAFAYKVPTHDIIISTALKKTANQFSKVKTVTQLLSIVKPSLSESDYKWLSQQKEFADIPNSAKISVKGDSLILAIKGGADITISVIDQKRLLFSVNGERWRYRPYQPIQKTINDLRIVLSQNSKTTFFNQAFRLLIPEAQAFAFLTVIGGYVVITAAATALCSAIASGSDALGCLMIPALPFIAIGKAGDAISDLKEAIVGIDDRALLVESMNCEVDKKGQFVRATLNLYEGSFSLLKLKTGNSKGSLRLHHPSLDNDKENYIVNFSYDKKYLKVSEVPVSGRISKKDRAAVTKSFKDVQDIVDLCENDERYAQFMQMIYDSKNHATPISVFDSKYGKTHI